MRLIVLASGAFAEPTIRWLARCEHEIALVVTQPARAGGRGRHSTPTPVRRVADLLGLPVVEVDNVNSPDFVEQMISLDARLMLAIAFGQKLGPDFLASTPGGAINLHASLLPKYRGAAPINWAIVRGERETGNTVFRIVSRMDAGPVLAQHATPIELDETAGALHDRLAALGVRTVQDALALFVGDADPSGAPQNEECATLAPKLKKSDGSVNFAQPAQDIVNHVRGMSPWPGSIATFISTRGRREAVTMTRVQAVDAATTHPPGIRPGVVDDRLLVAAADGFVQVLEIKPASGRAMSWSDFVNGRHVAPGDRFEPSA